MLFLGAADAICGRFLPLASLQHCVMRGGYVESHQNALSSENSVDLGIQDLQWHLSSIGGEK